MPDHPAPVTRRSLLAAGLGGTALVAAGCDAVESVVGGGSGPSSSGGTTSTAAAADIDATLVAQLGAAVAGAGALATAFARTHPTLSDAARRLARVHAAHAGRLGWSGTVDPPVVRPGRRAALRQLRRAEADLQDRLVAGAQQAASGALAQTVASMAAAVAQQRAVLG